MSLMMLLSFILAYLLGSVPSGYYAGKYLFGIDIREHGSKNIGATNTLRVLGRTAGIGVLLFDILKGFVAVKIAGACSIPVWPEVIAGLLAIVGHNWSIFLSFKGGKGVATSTGVFLALVPLSLLSALILFVMTVALTRYISLGSMLGAIALGGASTIQYAGQWGDTPDLMTLILVYMAVVFIIIRHRSNIQRLLNGTENRFYFRKTEK